MNMIRYKNKLSIIFSLICIGCGSSDYNSSSNSNSYYYNNWSCANISQCISVMGHNFGSAGPFCSYSACQAWGNQYVQGSYSCNSTAIYSIYNSPASGSCQY